MKGMTEILFACSVLLSNPHRLQLKPELCTTLIQSLFHCDACPRFRLD